MCGRGGGGDGDIKNSLSAPLRSPAELDGWMDEQIDWWKGMLLEKRERGEVA